MATHTYAILYRVWSLSPTLFFFFFFFSSDKLVQSLLRTSFRNLALGMIAYGSSQVVRRKQVADDVPFSGSFHWLRIKSTRFRCKLLERDGKAEWSWVYSIAPRKKQQWQLMDWTGGSPWLLNVISYQSIRPLQTTCALEVRF